MQICFNADHAIFIWKIFHIHNIWIKIKRVTNSTALKTNWNNFKILRNIFLVNLFKIMPSLSFGKVESQTCWGRYFIESDITKRVLNFICCYVLFGLFSDHLFVFSSSVLLLPNKCINIYEMLISKCLYRVNRKNYLSSCLSRNYHPSHGGW